MGHGQSHKSARDVEDGRDAGIILVAGGGSGVGGRRWLHSRLEASDPCSDQTATPLCYYI